MTQVVELFTDGACSGNPGPGGWGVLMRYGGQEKTLCGGEALTTNNKMELQAAVEGLNALKRACDVVVTTDSTYVRDGITKWVHGWQKNGWKTAAKKPVKNADIWRALLAAVERHNSVEWRWVKGHAGHRENEIADQLARDGMARC